jgi:hypothetical protein
MTESFSFQRFLNLFQWQMPKIQPFRFILISIVIIMSSYLQTMIHYERMNSFSDKLIVFIFIIVFCSNFFKQLITDETPGSFLLLPASTNEKFLFLMTSVVIIPIMLLVALVRSGDLLARTLHEVPVSYSYMNFQIYFTVLFVASVTFFVHCLPRKGWTLGLTLIFMSFLIPITIGYFKRKVVFVPIISDILSAINHPLILILISSVVLYLAYVFFKRNEISNFKVYE